MSKPLAVLTECGSAMLKACGLSMHSVGKIRGTTSAFTQAGLDSSNSRVNNSRLYAALYNLCTQAYPHQNVIFTLVTFSLSPVYTAPIITTTTYKYIERSN
jgi:hypothetical protein